MSGDLLFMAFIYLAAGVVSVPIAKRLGLGSVLGYLIAGVIIGPYALGLIGGGEQQESVMHFAEFGVVMMLFLIGLELRPALLWHLRGPILGLGGCQVLATAVAITGVAIAFDVSWRPAIAVGLTLALSSTAIVLQTLGEQNLLSTDGGRSSFAVLLFQDIAVIPMLAVLPLLALPSPDSADSVDDQTLHAAGATAEGAAESAGTWMAGLPGWTQGLIVLGAVVAIVIAGKFLMHPMFRFIAATRLREIFTATALLLVVGVTLAMNAIGLSPALGTFVAGVVLADSEYRHELESDIEPFKGLLLGLFFISVGASIDFALIGTEPATIALLTLALILGKFAVLFALGRVFRMSLPANLLLAFVLAQGGEFAFVLFAFAVQNDVLPQALADRLIAVVALSMALTPILMLVYLRFIRPLFSGAREEHEPDEIDEENPVLIAGYGRFGQIVNRLLEVNHISSTVLDQDPAHIEMLRRFGRKVFYGDATRVELLQSAGAAKAKLLVIAVDDRERAVELAETMRKHFPQAQILARAYDRPHVYKMMDAGVEHVYRETFSSALDMGEQALRLLGFPAYQAHRAALAFRKLDEATIRELQPHHRDERFLSMARASADELVRVLQADRQEVEEYSQVDRGFESVAARKRREAAEQG